MRDELTEAILKLGVFLFLLITLFALGIFVFAGVAVGAILVWIYLYYRRKEREKELRREAIELHHEATERIHDFLDLDPRMVPAYAEKVFELEANKRGLTFDNPPLLEAAEEVFHDIFKLYSEPPPLPEDPQSIDALRIRSECREILRTLVDPEEAQTEVLTRTALALADYAKQLPDDAFAPVDGFLSVTRPAAQAMRDPADAIEGIWVAMAASQHGPGKITTPVQNLFYFNFRLMSGIPREQITHISKDEMTRFSKPLLLPSDYKGELNDLVYGYLADTPFLPLFDFPILLAIPDELRFQHQWIIAPPGSGKSTFLQHLLLNDFAKVARGEASVIVIESNRDLIKAIEGLRIFDEELRDRLIAIDVEDVEYPLALNLFDMTVEGDSPRDREMLSNAAVAMLDYVFRALLGAELTSRQSTLFNFTIQLLIAIPESTLDTFIDLMQPGGLAQYAHHLDRLSPDARKFFATKFDDSSLTQTKSQVVDRLFAVKRVGALARMFAAPRTRLDLFKEMGAGKVIVINSAKSLLQEEGVEIFGRFFLASILFAAEKRQLLPAEERLPTYFYIDEAQDIIRRDEKLPIILDQARKNRVGMVLAHQRIDQLQPPVISALMGSTAIKCAARVSDANAHALARNMETTPEFIRNQPNYTFAVHARGVTDTAVHYRVPHVDMMKLPRTTTTGLREAMRERYAIPLDATEATTPVAEPATDGAGSEAEAAEGGVWQRDS